jgi:hypothetical protein
VGVLNAALLGGALVLSVVALVRGAGLVPFILFFGVVSGSYLILLIMHLEVRYLIPLQVMAPMMFAVALAWLGAGRRADRTKDCAFANRVTAARSMAAEFG